jgi:uncharacterized protein YegP (UPF0339 family)
MTSLTNVRTLALALLVSFGAAACANDATDVDSAQAETTARAHFDLWEDHGRWFFQVVSGNGEAILESQAYTSRVGALNGVLSVVENGPLVERYAIGETADGPFVMLKAANGHVIAQTEAYATRSNASRAAESTAQSMANYVAAWTDQTGARFQIFQGSDRQFYFRLVARNGNIMLRSEGYLDQASALNGAYVAKDLGVKVESFAVKTSASGGFYLTLLAANNEIIGVSEVYSTKASAERAAASIAALLPTIELI